MYIYILCFIVSSFCIWQSEIVKSKKIKILFEVLGILIICTLAGLRSDEIGTDVGIYCKPLYEQAETSTSFRDYLSKRVTNSRIVSDYEIGFITLVFLCAKIFENFQILLFAIQLLIVVPIFKGIKIISKKENNRIWLSMLIFYCMFYNVSLNLMRQFIAIGFIFLGTANLISNENKKNIKFVICLLIGFLFHSSALMGLLIYALYKVINHSYKKVRIGNINIPLKQIATVLISITGIFLLINNNILVTILNLFDMQYYTRYIEGNVSFLTSTVFKLLPVIFLFAFSNKKELKNKNNNYYFYILLFLYSVIVDQFTSVNVFAARIAFVFAIFNIISFSEMVYSLKRNVNIKVAKTFIFIYISAYWYYYFVYEGGHETIPYKFFWN